MLNIYDSIQISECVIQYIKIPPELENALVPYAFQVTNVYYNNNRLSFDCAQNVYIQSWMQYMMQGENTKTLKCDAIIKIDDKKYKIAGMFPISMNYNQDYFTNEFCFDYIKLLETGERTISVDVTGLPYKKALKRIEQERQRIKTEVDIKALEKDLSKKPEKQEVVDEELEEIIKELDEELADPEKSWEKRFNAAK